MTTSGDDLASCGPSIHSVTSTRLEGKGPHVPASIPASPPPGGYLAEDLWYIDLASEPALQLCLAPSLVLGLQDVVQLLEGRLAEGVHQGHVIGSLWGQGHLHPLPGTAGESRMLEQEP